MRTPPVARVHGGRLTAAIAAFTLASALWSFAAPLPRVAPLVFTPLNPSGIYRIGERAGWTVTVAGGQTASREPYTYVIKENNLDTIATGSLDLSSGTALLTATLDRPGMLYAQVSGEGLGKNGAVSLGAAVAPTEIPPAVPRPPDFDAFWNAKLDALHAVPMNPDLVPAPTTASGVDLFTVTLDSLHSHAHGYLATPVGGGKHPALVIFQYAGVYALQPHTVTDRAAEGWLAFDVDSHDQAPDAAAGAPRNYQAVGNTDRETSYFLNMYLRDVRAIEYVASRPDWDGKTLVVMGTSMGGQQSLAAAGLDSKVTAVIVNEPSGADSNGGLHGRKTGYPNWPADDPNVMTTALYFDTVNFAPRITAPALVAMGFIDTTAPPVGIWAAFNEIPGVKEAVPMIESDHNNITPEKQDAYNTRAKDVLDRILRGGVFTPR